MSQRQFEMYTQEIAHHLMCFWQVHKALTRTLAE
jgi:hypothetical protein